MSKKLKKKLRWYGEKAKMHWEEYLPKMVAEMKKAGTYQTALLNAQTQTEKEMSLIMKQLMKKGYSKNQALVTAEEIVLPRYILLPEEGSEEEEGSVIMEALAMWMDDMQKLKEELIESQGTIV